MIDFFRPLFLESINSYSYNSSVDEVRLKVELILEKSRHTFSDIDIDGRLTGGDTFQIETQVPAATKGVVYHSKLYGVLKPDNEGGTYILTSTRSADSLRLLFWISITIGTLYIIRYLITDANQSIWPGVFILTVGPIVAAKVADINNGVIKDRYLRYIHKKLAA